MERANKSQQQIAEACEITASTVNQWLSDLTKPGAKSAYRLAEFLGVSQKWLIEGKGAPFAQGLFGVAQTVADYNVSQVPLSKLVPVISWVAAGGFCEAADPFLPGQADEWIACPTKGGPNVYGLKVRGDSMTATHGKSYPDGCVIFVDPDLRSPVNGQRVIACVEGASEVTFKVFVQDAGKVWLKPLNPQHPSIFDPFKVVGTVIGKWEGE